MAPYYSLGVGLLEEGAPELIVIFWVSVDELVSVGREAVVDDDILPLAEAPEAEVEDAGILLLVILIPVLFLGVGHHLYSYNVEG